MEKLELQLPLYSVKRLGRVACLPLAHIEVAERTNTPLLAYNGTAYRFFVPKTARVGDLRAVTITKGDDVSTVPLEISAEGEVEPTKIGEPLVEGERPFLSLGPP